jgi:hypothetical protein
VQPARREETPIAPPQRPNRSPRQETHGQQGCSPRLENGGRQGWQGKGDLATTRAPARRKWPTRWASGYGESRSESPIITATSAVLRHQEGLATARCGNSIVQQRARPSGQPTHAPRAAPRSTCNGQADS